MTNLLARLQEVSCAPANSVGIQIDLETWGKKPGCAIRSIGASVWDNMTGQQVPWSPTFYANVCKKSCFDKGLTFDADTVQWWDKQGDAAKAALEVDQVSLTQALNDLRCWYGHVINAHGDGIGANSGIKYQFNGKLQAKANTTSNVLDPNFQFNGKSYGRLFGSEKV